MQVPIHEAQVNNLCLILSNLKPYDWEIRQMTLFFFTNLFMLNLFMSINFFSCRTPCSLSKNQLFQRMIPLFH